MMKKVFAIVAFIAIFVGCKTDVDVNAPYDTVPIIYGILDQSTDTQFIKINKTFLGKDNQAYAAINDSNLFKNVNARVEQYTNGILGNVYALNEIWVKDIDEGIFYTDSQKVYYFVEPNLDKNSTYKIVGQADNKSFSAETDMIGTFNFSNFTILSTQNGLTLAAGNGVYSSFLPKWEPAENAALYDLSLRIYFDEHTSSGIKTRNVDWFVGQLNNDSISTGLLEKTVEGELFYQYLASLDKLNETSGVIKRVIRDIDVRVTAANEILNTYVEVNQPITNIITERPEYTNVTGGLGLFASRQVLTLNRSLNKFSVEELSEGQLTGNQLFCTDSVDYVGESYYCP